MKVIKVINNNTVIAVNKNNKKVILTGKGIGFKSQKGDIVKRELINQRFILDENGGYERYTQLINDIPEYIFPIAEKIIHYARTNLGKTFSDNIYLTLSDHLNFSIERTKQGLVLQNALHWETKNFYPDEYMIGEKALNIIKKELQIDLHEHEKSFIALHFVNAELNEDMSQTYEITKFLQDVQNIVKYHFQVSFDENSLNYYRFITHLKFFAKRIINNDQFVDEDEVLYDVVKSEMSKYFACTQKIKDYVYTCYNIEFSKQEAIYLTIHLKRVLSKL